MALMSRQWKERRLNQSILLGKATEVYRMVHPNRGKIQNNTCNPLLRNIREGCTRGSLRDLFRDADLHALSILLFAISLLFLTASRTGNFWWPDAPRHAMDGAFVRDLIVKLPIMHLRQWAMNYYLHYPAVVILHYPPLFALVEAVFFLVFGVSQFSAQLTVAVFYMMAAAAAYAIARLWVDRVQALAISLLFVGAHEIALWGRQVMLEIPTYTFILWSSYFLLLYLKNNATRYLPIAAILLAAALYTKQTAVFMLVVFVITAYTVKGKEMIRDSRLGRALILFMLLTLPLLLFTFRFGTRHFITVTGGSLSNYTNTRFNVASWLFYARRLPNQVGWPILALAGLYPILSLASKTWGLPKYAVAFLSSWFTFGYIFFSALQVHESRHSSLILFPLVIFAVSTLSRLLPLRASPYVVLASAVAVFVHTLLYDPVPRIDGYQEAADYIGSHAQEGSIVLFSGSGWGGGPFIFDLRARYGGKNLIVLRADRLLYRYSLNRERGLEEIKVTQQQIADMLNSFGVGYVVIQPNFWNDLSNIQGLQAIMQTPQFKKVADLPISASVEDKATRLEIYENLRPIPIRDVELRIELPDVGLTVDEQLDHATPIQ
jgi:4-amino-4-deoxy-L-arabinose transferase-like glycosyltransferase